MSLGEHLEDLRKTLVRALIGVGLGCVVGFIFATDVVETMNQPLMDALTKFRQDRARERLIAQEGFIAPEFTPWLTQDKLAPETVYVDPGQLVAALRRVSPDFLAGVNLDPYGFSAEQLAPEKLGDISRQWTNGRDDESPEGERLDYLWQRLTAGEQSLLNRLAATEVATEEDTREFIRLMNRLSDDRGLSEAPAFQALVAPPESSFWNFLVPAKTNPLQPVKAKLDESFDADLNRRLNRVLICGLFVDQIPALRMDMVPIQIWEKIHIQPQSLKPTESFMIWIKAGLISGLLIASPWVLFQIWCFVAVGLHVHERKYVYIFLPISLILFFSGALLAFFFVFQPVLAFLFTFDAQMGIEPQPRVNEWLSFVLFLPLGFGIAFQLPLVMLFLNRINVFQVKDYLSKWRVAVMIIFVLSMILTPADPISMILLAIPLTALYFFGIGLCVWLPRKENPFEQAAVQEA